MLSLCTLSLSLLLATYLPAAVSSPTPPQSTDEALLDAAAFQQLLTQVDPPALHAALHNFNPTRFRHGSFQQDRDAAFAIHKADPVLASSMVGIAKRQSDNNTAELPMTSTTPTTLAAIASSTLGTGVVGASTSIVTENPSPITVVVTSTSTSTSASSPSTPASDTTTSLSPTTSPAGTTPSSSSPTVAPTSSSTTPSSTSPGTSTSPSSSSPNPSSTASSPTSTSSTDSRSKTSSAASSHASVVLRTTTLADGAVQTITSVTVVSGPQGAETGAGSGGAATSTGPSGSLQSQNCAVKGAMGLESWGIVGAMGGAVVFAWAL